MNFLFTPLAEKERKHLQAPPKAEKLRCEACDCGKFIVLKTMLPLVKDGRGGSRYYGQQIEPPRPQVILVCLNCRAAREVGLGEPMAPKALC